MESLSHDLLTGVKPLFSSSADNVQPLGLLTPKILPEGHPGANGGRYFTIQRVNGNGANGKNDGCPGGHRHTLEESDRVKKNSVQRHFLKETKERKKAAAVCLHNSSFYTRKLVEAEVPANTSFSTTHHDSHSLLFLCSLQSAPALTPWYNSIKP